MSGTVVRILQAVQRWDTYRNGGGTVREHQKTVPAPARRKRTAHRGHAIASSESMDELKTQVKDLLQSLEGDLDKLDPQVRERAKRLRQLVGGDQVRRPDQHVTEGDQPEQRLPCLPAGVDVLDMLTAVVAARRSALEASRYQLQELQPDGTWTGNGEWVSPKEKPMRLRAEDVGKKMRFSFKDLAIQGPETPGAARRTTRHSPSQYFADDEARGADIDTDEKPHDVRFECVAPACFAAPAVANGVLVKVKSPIECYSYVDGAVRNEGEKGVKKEPLVVEARLHPGVQMSGLRVVGSVDDATAGHVNLGKAQELMEAKTAPTAAQAAARRPATALIWQRTDEVNVEHEGLPYQAATAERNLAMRPSATVPSMRVATFRFEARRNVSPLFLPAPKKLGLENAAYKGLSFRVTFSLQFNYGTEQFPDWRTCDTKYSNEFKVCPTAKRVSNGSVVLSSPGARLAARRNALSFPRSRPHMLTVFFAAGRRPSWFSLTRRGSAPIQDLRRRLVALTCDGYCVR